MNYPHSPHDMIQSLSPLDTISSFHSFLFFFFNDTATTEIYTLSLHDALPISASPGRLSLIPTAASTPRCCAGSCAPTDRKSTRLNSSHVKISYAVFCLKKKKQELKLQHFFVLGHLYARACSPENYAKDYHRSL